VLMDDGDDSFSGPPRPALPSHEQRLAADWEPTRQWRLSMEMDAPLSTDRRPLTDRGARRKLSLEPCRARSSEPEQAAKQQWLAQTKCALEEQLQRRQSLSEHTLQTSEQERSLLNGILEGWSRMASASSSASAGGSDSRMGSFKSVGGTEEDGINESTGNTWTCKGDETGDEHVQGRRGFGDGPTIVAEVARQIKAQWLNEQRKEWAAGLAARQQFALDPKEAVVLVRLPLDHLTMCAAGLQNG